jgi:hypothetical protein
VARLDDQTGRRRREFIGEDYQAAHVPPPAQAVLAAFDDWSSPVSRLTAITRRPDAAEAASRAASRTALSRATSATSPPWAV